MTEEEMIDQLKVEMILNYGSWAAFAKSLGFSKALMSQMINGKRVLNKALLDHIGVEKQVSYLKLNQKKADL